MVRGSSPFPIDWLDERRPSAYGGLRADGDSLTWLEGRPEDDGRVRLVRRAADGTTDDLVPARGQRRSRVHGTAAAHISAAAIRRRLGLRDRTSTSARRRPWEPLTPKSAHGGSPTRLDAARGRLVAVREDHEPETLARHGEAENAIVSIEPRVRRGR